MEERFSWGTTAACADGYTSAVTVNGNNFSYNLGEIPPGTYYYQAWARNSVGWGHSTSASFNTVVQPNLTPYQNTGWSDKIVVARTANSTTDSTSLTTADTLYVNAGIINNGAVATAVNFNNEFYVDGVPTYNWVTPAPLNVNYVSSLTTGYSIGQLSAGTHTIKITADYGGVIAESDETDNSYTKTITVGSSQGSPVSTTLSTLTATPSSAAADGQTSIAAKVTLRDGNNNPVAGKTVKIYSSGSVVISQSANVTDANGTATGTITATAPVTTSIWAVDTTDSVLVQQQPTIQFTSAFVAPGNDLSSAITQLANSSATILNNDMGSYAITDGQDGDYFRATLSSDERANGANALFTGIGSLITLLGPEGNLIKETGIQVAKSEGISVGLDIAPNAALDLIATSDTGLTTYGQNIANNNYNDQQSELLKEQQLLSGVPPPAASLSSAYVSDIALRIKANQDLDLMALAEKNLILNLRLQSEQTHIDMLSKIFIPVNMVGTLAQDCIPVYGKSASVLLTLAEAFDSYAFNQPNLSFGNNAANTANTAMLNCSAYSGMVDGNVESAFNQIAMAKSPSPIVGKMSSVDSVRTYVPASGWLGVVGTLTGWFNGKTYVTTTGAHSGITIQNNNQQSATFGVNAVYWVTTSINDQLGDSLVPITVPYVASTSVTIPANQSAQATLNYFNNGNAAAPDVNQPITIYLLGYDNNKGIYEADFSTSYAQWQLDSSVSSAIKAKPLGGPSPEGGPTSTNLFAMENPINCYVVPNPSNQTYQAHILVANPFAIPLQSVVTQPLPPGISVLSTTGLLSGASIVWTNTIVTNGLADDSFTFTLPVLPGMQTNLPMPTLVFSDSTGTNSWTIQAAASAFTGVFPIRVANSIPSGKFGMDTPMQVTITNPVAASESGYLTVSVADLNGNAITNFSAAFSVNGGAGTNLNFSLPGNMPVGQYFITDTLNMDGGSGQVWAGVYVVRLAPITLGLGSTTPWSTNGFNLMLQGTLGSNYVIEVSTDLFNWTPIMDFTVTNSQFYFNDPAATNSGRQFYRAVMP